MNIDEWDFLSDDGGFLDFSEDAEKKAFLGKRYSDSKSVFDMDYFMCPSPTSMNITEPSRNPRLPDQLVPVPIPIRLEPRIRKAPDDDEADQDTVSQVFFKIKENEFVDMKMDSPRSGTRGMLPPIDTGGMKFDDKGETREIMISPRLKIEKEMLMDKEEDDPTSWEHHHNGIGAICSFGVAAATICILFFGSNQRNKHNHKIRFQIYADDKRIKQVMQQANKMNEAISAATGVHVPLTTAHITYGGYHDAL
ncbi:uncharacterized protein G2W53_024735 [Senna tora]|uniref:DUF6821 domain-containing protein n=1 Tax=Senna tora TaxID=362788 RepID=A0A834TDV9_9FABA|nr:uncharacterized protein G2W53_024735 [Senna tora]